MIDSRHVVKLGDFGLGKPVGDGKTNQTLEVGTRLFSI